MRRGGGRTGTAPTSRPVTKEEAPGRLHRRHPLSLLRKDAEYYRPEFGARSYGSVTYWPRKRRADSVSNR